MDFGRILDDWEKIQSGHKGSAIDKDAQIPEEAPGAEERGREARRLAALKPKAMLRPPGDDGKPRP